MEDWYEATIEQVDDKSLYVCYPDGSSERIYTPRGLFRVRRSSKENPLPKEDISKEEDTSKEGDDNANTLKRKVNSSDADNEPDAHDVHSDQSSSKRPKRKAKRSGIPAQRSEVEPDSTNNSEE